MPPEICPGSLSQVLLHAHGRKQLADALLSFRVGQAAVAFEGEGHILLHGQRVVECRILEEESDLLPDFVQLRALQAGDFLSVDANRPRVGLLQSDDQFQQHALARATLSQDGYGLALGQF
jgi:hypothetical protein